MSILVDGKFPTSHYGPSHRWNSDTSHFTIAKTTNRRAMPMYTFKPNVHAPKLIFRLMTDRCTNKKTGISRSGPRSVRYRTSMSISWFGHVVNLQIESTSFHYFVWPCRSHPLTFYVPFMRSHFVHMYFIFVFIWLNRSLTRPHIT